MNGSVSIIQLRFFKSDFNKKCRLCDKVKIFKPSWICNEQNNLIDETPVARKNQIVATQRRFTLFDFFRARLPFVEKPKYFTAILAITFHVMKNLLKLRNCIAF